MGSCLGASRACGRLGDARRTCGTHVDAENHRAAGGCQSRRARSALPLHERGTPARGHRPGANQLRKTIGTTVALSQRHYEAGQTGEIVARFAVGERIGLQKKIITVSTSDAPVPTVLTLVVHIPELVRIHPTSVIWEPGEPNQPKIIQIESVQSAVPLEEVALQGSNPALSATLRPTADRGKFELSVYPETTDRTLFTTLTIRCRVGAEIKTFRAFAGVRATSPPSPIRNPAAKPVGKPWTPVPDDGLVPPG